MKRTAAGVYGYSTRKKLCFSLGQYTAVFRVEYFAIKACTMDIPDSGHRNRNIYILAVEVRLQHSPVTRYSQKWSGTSSNLSKTGWKWQSSNDRRVGSQRHWGQWNSDWQDLDLNVHLCGLGEHVSSSGTQIRKDFLQGPCARKTGELLKLNGHQAESKCLWRWCTTLRIIGFLELAVLYLWGAYSDERTGLQFAVWSLNGPSRMNLLTSLVISIQHAIYWRWPRDELLADWDVATGFGCDILPRIRADVSTCLCTRSIATLVRLPQGEVEHSRTSLFSFT
jgi:hypothetical protein